MILLPARTSQIVRLLMNSHSFSSRTLMEALHKNVEWTEVIKVLTPFSGGIYLSLYRYTFVFAIVKIHPSEMAVLLKEFLRT